MRRILFLAQAEVLHIVRDRVLLAQVLVVPDRAAARSCRTPRPSRSATRRSTSSTSIASTHSARRRQPPRRVTATSRSSDAAPSLDRGGRSAAARST